MLSLTLVFFQFFAGHGLFTGEVAAYDGELYRVVYEDGDMEECDDQEIEDIVLTPDTADHSSSKDVGDDDKVANAAHESGARIASKLKTSPFRPVKGSERHRIDQAETDTCEGAILDNVSESESGSAVHQNVADKCNVIILQSIVRRRAGRNVAEQKRRQLMDKSATAIQAAWRCYCGRSSYGSKLLGVIVLQRLVRGRVARNVAERKRELSVQSATKIQTAWRGYWALSTYETKLFVIVLLQSLARRRAAEIVAEQKRRELEERESRLEKEIETLDCNNTAKRMECKTASTKAVEQEGELLEKSAEIPSGDPFMYSIGTKVKKVSMAPKNG